VRDVGEIRFASCLGSPVGAARVSFGLATNDKDIRRAVELIDTFRD
jgi:selenocysteine lyase/cysteine desulfurase